MSEVADGAQLPVRLHDLLLGFAGRLDDDALSQIRELIAVAECDRAVELMVGCLVAGNVEVSEDERDEVDWLLDEVRSERALAGLLRVVDAVPESRHRFTVESEPEQGLADALGRVVDALPDIRSVQCVWRTTPAGRTPGPLPQRVVLVDIGAAGHAPATAYRIEEVLRKNNIHAAVEVLRTGLQLGEYHAAALAEAVPVPLHSGGYSGGSGFGEDTGSRYGEGGSRPVPASHVRSVGRRSAAKRESTADSRGSTSSGDSGAEARTESRSESVAEASQDGRAESRTRASARTDARAEASPEPLADSHAEATRYQQVNFTADYQQTDYQQSDYQQSDYQQSDYQPADYQSGEHQLVEHQSVEHQSVEQPGIAEAPAVAQQAVRETHAHAAQQSGREAHALVEQHSLVDSRGVEHTYSRPGQGVDLPVPPNVAPRAGQPGPTAVQPMPVLPPPVYQAPSGPSGNESLPVLPPPVYQPSASESVTAEMSPAELAELRAALADPAAPPPPGVRRPTAEEVPAPSMQLPASVDAKLNDRERDLLRQLHEELAQREKKSASETSGGWQVNRNQPNGYGQRAVPGAWGNNGPAPETGNAPPPNQNRGGTPYSSSG